jgi:hypothetical protein
MAKLTLILGPPTMTTEQPSSEPPVSAWTLRNSFYRKPVHRPTLASNSEELGLTLIVDT